MESIKKLWYKPQGLRGYAGRFYNRTGRYLVEAGALTELDRESFISLCRAYDLMQRSLDAIESEGVNVKGRGDEMKRNPALTTYKNASDVYNRLARKFYLTPQDRKGAELRAPRKTNAKDVFFG